MRSLPTIALVALLGACGKDSAKERPAAEKKSWWCHALVCERSKELCLEGGVGRLGRTTGVPECQPQDRALCAAHRDYLRGDYVMCHPSIEKCMEMIETTEFAYEVESSDAEPKRRKLSPEEGLKRCADTTP